MKFTILIIDDEKNIREGLAANFELEDYNVKTAASGEEGLEYVSKGDIDLVISDLRMNGMGGEEVLQRVTAQTPGVPVIILTGHGDVNSAVDAMRHGAYDFLLKPVDLDQLTMIVKRALENRQLRLEHQQLKKEVEDSSAFSTMIGKSSAIMKMQETIRKVAESRASVLITGESGVGKELVARAIHNYSSRKAKEMINVHCAALSETLLESELFGHEKGAFTGADHLKKGRFELAHGSTIFLDEIGEINQSVQIKILRVLQERRFERVGGEQTIEVDVRVVAATNRNLEEEVKKGRFREDLYYRLNVVHIHVPPLRERKEDIPLLIQSFLDEFNRENSKNITGLDSKAKSAMFKYDWPGNIRELRNCMESAVVMCSGDHITIDDLPPGIAKKSEGEVITVPLGQTLEETEKTVILENLAANRNNKSKTADLLGIGRKTLQRKLSEWGIDNSGE
ncbi:sigma-54-dependent Fis family transcriptional regulator [Treponema rectale]|uniref:DNA-binding NtrC family response regulator n=1 Tax=Treponema rectale TaxID=744512 RepID=A0A840SE60_9SPIR|nr:sigma-54 dependent transcriptional regulator [Treponema rectale]MBB5218226.1 DNA-binding NtrC family response regulator [Treponema rectale]QOS40071.1 sigma-54-dependent Fis family transcriptional regulator [Treponema rectale]